MSKSNSNSEASASATEVEVEGGVQAKVKAQREKAMEDARVVAGSGMALKVLLKKEWAGEACRLLGIEPQELRPRPRASFDIEPGRAWRVHAHKSALRFETFENNRVHKIASVLLKAQDTIRRLDREHGYRAAEAHSIAENFARVVQAEGRRLQKIEDNRLRLEGVLLKENHSDQHKREAFERSKRHIALREKQLHFMRGQTARKMRQRAVASKRKIEAVQASKDQMLAAKVKAYRELMEKQQEQVTTRLLTRQVEEEERRREDIRRDLLRKQVRSDQLAVEKERTEYFNRQILIKEARIKRLQEKQRMEREKFKEQQLLERSARVENVMHFRAAKKYRTHLTMDKIQQHYDRIDAQKALREALVEERHKHAKMLVIRQDQWRRDHVLNRDVAPGPGEYALPSSFRVMGGTWGKYKPKSEVEWLMLRSAKLPGPGEYDTSLKWDRGHGWSRGSSSSALEVNLARAAALPGPGFYDPVHGKHGGMPTIGNFAPQSYLDGCIARGKETPGPADYGAPNVPKPKPRLRQLRHDLAHKYGKYAARAEQRGEATHSPGFSTSVWSPSSGAGGGGALSAEEADEAEGGGGEGGGDQGRWEGGA